MKVKFIWKLQDQGAHLFNRVCGLRSPKYVTWRGVGGDIVTKCKI